MSTSPSPGNSRTRLSPSASPSRSGSAPSSLSATPRPDSGSSSSSALAPLDIGQNSDTPPSVSHWGFSSSPINDGVAGTSPEPSNLEQSSEPLAATQPASNPAGVARGRGAARVPRGRGAARVARAHERTPLVQGPPPGTQNGVQSAAKKNPAKNFFKKYTNKFINFFHPLRHPGKALALLAVCIGIPVGVLMAPALCTCAVWFIGLKIATRFKEAYIACTGIGVAVLATKTTLLSLVGLGVLASNPVGWGILAAVGGICVLLAIFRLGHWVYRRYFDQESSYCRDTMYDPCKPSFTVSIQDAELPHYQICKYMGYTTFIYSMYIHKIQPDMRKEREKNFGKLTTLDFIYGYTLGRLNYILNGHYFFKLGQKVKTNLVRHFRYEVVLAALQKSRTESTNALNFQKTMGINIHPDLMKSFLDFSGDENTQTFLMLKEKRYDEAPTLEKEVTFNRFHQHRSRVIKKEKLTFSNGSLSIEIETYRIKVHKFPNEYDSFYVLDEPSIKVTNSNGKLQPQKLNFEYDQTEVRLKRLTDFAPVLMSGRLQACTVTLKNGTSLYLRLTTPLRRTSHFLFDIQHGEPPKAV